MAGCLTTGWLAKESAGLNSTTETQSQNPIRSPLLCNVSFKLSSTPPLQNNRNRNVKKSSNRRRTSHFTQPQEIKDSLVQKNLRIPGGVRRGILLLLKGERILAIPKGPDVRRFAAPFLSLISGVAS